jgi:hypothetical protein
MRAPPTVRRARPFIEAAGALAFFTAAAVAVTWPIARSLGGLVLGVVDSDSATMIWWLDRLQETGFHVVGTTHLADVAAPFGADMSNALNIQWAWPFLPAHLITSWHGPVVAYNVTLLTGLAFSGAATYALARALGACRLVAGWAGLVYLVFPWHVERAVAGHASLIHLECFPLLALALLALARRRTGWRVALLAGAVLLCWLTSGYYGVMALVVVGVASLTWALCTSPRGPALRAAAATTAVALVVTLGVAGAALAGGGDGGVGQARPVDNVTRFGLRPLELVVPAPGSPALARLRQGFWESRRHGSNIQETSNYLGWTTIGLALAWLLLVRRRTRPGDALRRVTASAASVGAVAVLLALPGRVDVLGADVAWMPSRLLYEVVPAFRVPSRWTPVLLLAVLVLATLGLAELVRLVRGRIRPSRAPAAVAALVAGLALVSVTELRVTHPGVHYDPDAVPEEYSLVDGIPPGSLAEYPMVQWEDTMNGAYVLRQLRHGRRLVNVAPSPWRSPVEGLRRTLVDPAAPGAASALAALGATAVVTRPDTLSRALETPLPLPAPRLGAGYAFVGDTADGASVWRVTAMPAPAVAAADTATFGLPRQDARGRIVQVLEGSHGTIRLQRTDRGGTVVRAVLRLVVHAPGRVEARVGGTRVLATPGGTPVAVTVRVPLSGLEVPVTVAAAGGPLAIGAPWVEAPR